jgi:hypothetical protein
VSLGVYLQGFRNGDSASVEGSKVWQALEPHVVDSGDTWAKVCVGDGDAEVYGVDDFSTGLMFTHLNGREVWDMVFEVARAGGCVVVPAEGPVGVLDEVDAQHVPAALSDAVGVVVVSSGSDLLRLIESS